MLTALSIAKYAASAEPLTAGKPVGELTPVLLPSGAVTRNVALSTIEMSSSLSLAVGKTCPYSAWSG